MTKQEIYVLYASQTGQAESIAENIHEEAVEQHDIKSTLICLKRAEEAFDLVSATGTPVVFVCSTTGDGEPPGNARKFIRMLQRRTLSQDHLSKLQYALLGLGDSNYTSFCGGPKTLQRALKKLGAQSFYSAGFADDGTDMEIVVEPWIQGLWPALKSHTQSQVTHSTPNITPANNPTEILHEEERLCEKLESNLEISTAANQVKTTPDNLSKTDSLEMNRSSKLMQLFEDLDSPLLPLPHPFLTFSMLQEDLDIDFPSFPIVPYPLAANDEFYSCEVDTVRQLSRDDAVKKSICLTLKIPPELQYEPGDSFGIFVPNPKAEVDWLLHRLNATDVADKPLTFAVRESCTKKNAKVPNYLPDVCTLRYALESCVEIRAVPKRAFFRFLYDFTTLETEKKVLHILACKAGMPAYIKNIREPNLNILDILAALPSCQPPIESLIEHLPRLRARLYSAASCLEANPSRVRFVFNVIGFEPSEGRMYGRKGVATGYMDNILKKMTKITREEVTKPRLTIFKTKNENFRLSRDQTLPVIMIGPGTGVAPFIGFLESLKIRHSQNGQSPEAWLFYGCRHRERDFLFRQELEKFAEDGILTHLVTCFSRDEVPNNEWRPKYVQENLTERGDEIMDLIVNGNASVFVCGDARNMAKEVRKTIEAILARTMPEDDVTMVLKKMAGDGRYKEDVWT